MVRVVRVSGYRSRGPGFYIVRLRIKDTEFNFFICTATYNYSSHKSADGYLQVSRKDRMDHLVSNKFIRRQ
jgi:hypothetical protein